MSVGLYVNVCLSLVRESAFLSFFFFLPTVLKFLFYFLEQGSSQDPNKCNTEILPHKNKVVVSWTINVAKLTPDSYAGICFGKVHSDVLDTILCWNKTSKAFFFEHHDESLFSWCKANKLRRPQATENRDGSVTVSVEMSSTSHVGVTVFWDVLWAEKMHNRAIDEMLYCTYTAGKYKPQ